MSVGVIEFICERLYVEMALPGRQYSTEDSVQDAQPLQASCPSEYSLFCMILLDYNSSLLLFSSLNLS